MTEIQEEIYYSNIDKKYYKAKYIIEQGKDAVLIKDVLISHQEATGIIQAEQLQPHTIGYFTFFKNLKNE